MALGDTGSHGASPSASRRSTVSLQRAGCSNQLKPAVVCMPEPKHTQRKHLCARLYISPALSALSLCDVCRCSLCVAPRRG